MAFAAVGAQSGIAQDPETGTIVAVDGELVTRGGPRAGAAAAEHVLREIRQHGEKLEPADGCFAAVAWQPAGQLLLLSDRAAMRSLYHCRRDGALLVGSEVKGVLAAGGPRTLDPTGVAQLLAYEQLLGERTLLDGVRRLPAATVRVLARTGEMRDRRWARYRLDPAEAPDGELLDAFGAALAGAVERRMRPGTVLALSGGLDSRCLALTLAELGWTGPAVTFGVAGSADLDAARRVARSLGLEHAVFELADGYISRGAEAVAWLAEGHARVFHAHQLAFRRLGPDLGAVALLIGYAGDIVARWGARSVASAPRIDPGAVHRELSQCVDDALLERVLVPAFANELRGRALSSLGDALAGEEGDDIARRNQFGFHQLLSRRVSTGPELFDHELAVRDPFLDAEVVGVLQRIPHRLRADGRLQRLFITQRGGVGGILSPKDGAAPASTGVGRWAAQRRTAAGRRLASRRGATRPGDYGRDLRANGGPLLGMLLEERTLARRQIRREPVREMIRQTLAGSSRHTKALGVLLTVELFQRQLLDGDGAPCNIDAGGRAWDGSALERADAVSLVATG